MLLEKIVASKREEIERAKAALPLEALRERLQGFEPAFSLAEHLDVHDRLALIAELKRKSPSKGMLRERFDPVSLAQLLQEAGADALSVLTDEPFFGGSLQFLRDVSAFTEIPRLRKDFILEPYQVYEAAWCGADAVLLIVRLLEDAQLRACLETAHELDMDALVEIHADAELDRALAAGARIIGINHRDLEDFSIDMRLSQRLMPRMPSGKIIVAESGIRTQEDVERMRGLGVHGLLIGESLMASEKPQDKIRELFGRAWKGRVIPGS